MWQTISTFEDPSDAPDANSSEEFEGAKFTNAEGEDWVLIEFINRHCTSKASMYIDKSEFKAICECVFKTKIT